jgi:hypothetical protein
MSIAYRGALRRGQCVAKYRETVVIGNIEESFCHTTLPAITLWQPWASLVAQRAKPFESRSWPPPRRLIGRRVAIHAAARPVHVASDPTLAAAIAAALGRADWVRTLPRGAVVCTARLAGAYRLRPGTVADRAVIDAAVEGSPPLAAIVTDPFGNYREGRWVWHLVGIAPLDPPVAAKGRQGWWVWDRLNLPAGVAPDASSPILPRRPG